MEQSWMATSHSNKNGILRSEFQEFILMFKGIR